MQLLVNERCMRGDYYQEGGFNSNKNNAIQLLLETGTRSDPQLAKLMSNFDQTPDDILVHVERILKRI